MLVKFTRMHRQWLPGQVADLGAGIADSLVRSRRAIYAVAPGKSSDEPNAVVKKSPRSKKSAKLS